MKKNKIFVACDTTNIKKIKNIISQTKNSISNLNPVAQGRCNYGKAILQRYKRYSPFLSSC